MVDIGRGVGRKVAAIIADMNQPLGEAVGNALEVKEAIETLQGGGPADFRDHCLAVGGKMLELAGKAPDLETAQATLAHSLKDGTAWDKFVEWIAAQGGDPAVLHDPSLLPQASLVETVAAPRSGFIAGIDAAEVGKTGVMLGGGRLKKGDPIDYSVGIVYHAKAGAQMQSGAPLLTIHANEAGLLETAQERLLAAIRWSETPVSPQPHIHKIIG